MSGTEIRMGSRYTSKVVVVQFGCEVGSLNKGSHMWRNYIATFEENVDFGMRQLKVRLNEITGILDGGFEDLEWVTGDFEKHQNENIWDFQGVPCCSWMLVQIRYRYG